MSKMKWFTVKYRWPWWRWSTQRSWREVLQDVDVLEKEDAENYLFCPLEPYPSEKNMASCLHWVREK